MDALLAFGEKGNHLAVVVIVKEENILRHWPNIVLCFKLATELAW